MAKGIATAEQFEQTFNAVQAEVDSPRYQCAMPMYIAYGQRAS